MTHGTQSSRSASPVVEVLGLRVSYRQHRRVREAVRGVDFQLREGEILSIVGESGSGKSSIASALLGLHTRNTEVHAETMRVMDIDVRNATQQRWRQLRRRVISLVPQDPLVSLNPAMRISQQVGEALRLAAVPKDDTDDTNANIKADEKHRVIQALEDAGLDSVEQRMHQYPHELSGGQRQRALIAIALACQPQVIIADEPTSALDVTVQRRILDHLELLVREHGISMMLITHDLAVAAERSQRMLVLDDGRVAEQGTTQQLLTAPKSPATQQLLKAAPGLSAAGELAWGRYQDRKPDLRAEPGAALISFDRVSKVYRSRGSDSTASDTVHALDDVTLNIGRGQTLGIVGESGSGKSTLLRTALSLTQPTPGTVTYDGQNLQDMTSRQLRQARRKFQFVHKILMPHLIPDTR